MTSHVTLERLITFLLETPMFQKLDPAEIKSLVDIVEIREFGAGETLFEEGAPGDAWYALYRGKVDVIKNVGDGQKEIHPLETGTCFGEIAILDGEPRSATVRAIEDSIALRISRDAFEALLNDERDVACKLLRNLAVSLAHRVRTTTERLSELVLEAQNRQLPGAVTQNFGETLLRD
jgi:CRP-like cAMP-binding protein